MSIDIMQYPMKGVWAEVENKIAALVCGDHVLGEVRYADGTRFCIEIGEHEHKLNSIRM